MFLDFHTHHTRKEAGVQNIYNVILNAGTMADEEWKNREAVSVGIHPWYIEEERTAEMLRYLEQVAGLPVVKCIGEAGLDKLRGPDLGVQQEVFIRQIRIAEAVSKPVVIHCVRAYQELMAVKKALNPRVALIIHGFARKPELAAELVSHGFYLSFGKNILDKPHVQQALRETPAERLFLETDDETGIKEIYEKAALLRGVTLNELQEKIKQNYSAIGLINK